MVGLPPLTGSLCSAQALCQAGALADAAAEAAALCVPVQEWFCGSEADVLTEAAVTRAVAAVAAGLALQQPSQEVGGLAPRQADRRCGANRPGIHPLSLPLSSETRPI